MITRLCFISLFIFYSCSQLQRPVEETGCVNNDLDSLIALADQAINNFNINECLEKGTEMSAKIIQRIGARLS